MSSDEVELWPDAALVAAARGGDRDAFATLIGRHRRTAVMVTARLLGSVDLAGDAVQEATVLAMNNLGRLRSPERFGAWLSGIALNVARRWLRELRRTAPITGDGPADAAAGPGERLEASELAGEVRRAVAELAGGQRDAVWLFYLQGLTHREVAAELDISVGAVKARLHQARAALTPRLAPFIETKEKTSMTLPATPEWIEMTVDAVRRDGGPDAARHVIVLGERGGDRHLPIWVGPFEATAVALSLEATEMPRPMTYDFAANLVTATNSRVSQVLITGMAEGIFYGTVVVDGPAGTGEVDARPSDALNLALVTGSPIRVDPQLLDDPSITGHPEWRDYPDDTTNIAQEVRQQREHDLAESAQDTTADAAETP